MQCGTVWNMSIFRMYYQNFGRTEYTKMDNTQVYLVDLRTAKLRFAVQPLQLIPILMKE